MWNCFPCDLNGRDVTDMDWAILLTSMGTKSHPCVGSLDPSLWQNWCAHCICRRDRWPRQVLYSGTRVTRLQLWEKKRQNRQLAFGEIEWEWIRFGGRVVALTSCDRKHVNNGRAALGTHALVASSYHLMLANAQKLVPTNDYKSTFRLVHDLMLHLNKWVNDKSKSN